MNGQSYKDFLLARLIYCTYVWNTVASDVIRYNNVNKTDKQIFTIFRAFVRKIGAEWVQNKQIFIWSVEKWLTENGNQQAHQIDSIFVKLVSIMIRSSGHTNSTSPN